MNSVLATPSWAYDFCYYYAFVAAIVVVGAIYSLVQLMMLPGLVKKLMPITSVSLTLILSTIVTVVLTMMQFWICRGALAPRTEKFAVQCKSQENCTAVMGPQTQTPDSLCTCGGRGFCGGCVMQNDRQGGNNTELPGFDSD